MVPGRFPHSQLRLLLDWTVSSFFSPSPLLFFFTNNSSFLIHFRFFLPAARENSRGLPAGPVSFSDNLSFLLFVPRGRFLCLLRHLSAAFVRSRIAPDRILSLLAGDVDPRTSDLILLNHSGKFDMRSCSYVSESQKSQRGVLLIGLRSPSLFAHALSGGLFPGANLSIQCASQKTKKNVSSTRCLNPYGTAPKARNFYALDRSTAKPTSRRASCSSASG